MPGEWAGRADGLEIHIDQRFNSDSIISAGSNDSPIRLWMNAVSPATIQKKLWIYNNAYNNIFSGIRVEPIGELLGIFDIELAEDVSGSPGTWIDSSKSLPGLLGFQVHY